MIHELAQQREPSGDCSPSPATELAQQREPSGDCSPSPATAAVWTGAADAGVRYFLSLRPAGSGTALCVCASVLSHEPESAMSAAHQVPPGDRARSRRAPPPPPLPSPSPS